MAVAASFFKPTIHKIIRSELKGSLNMREILAGIPPDSLLVLDIDDTIGRLEHVLGLDPWFRNRLNEFIEQEGDFYTALILTIALYNPIQQASPSMIPVDDSFSITELVDDLKQKGVTVIGLTARNNALVDATLRQLESLDFSFSQGVLEDSTFKLDGKDIEIKDGIIFCDGSNKGSVLLEAEKYLVGNLSDYHHITFVDDSIRNCNNMKDALDAKKLPYKIWHYPYAEVNHQFTSVEKDIANTQETYFLEHGTIPSDREAQEVIDARVSLAP